MAELVVRGDDELHGTGRMRGLGIESEANDGKFRAEQDCSMQANSLFAILGK